MELPINPATNPFDAHGDCTEAAVARAAGTLQST
jgi:hypothetical protein